MKSTNVRVVSEGIGLGTKVFIEGKEVFGVSAIKIEDTTPNCLTSVTLTIEACDVDLAVTDLEPISKQKQED